MKTAERPSKEPVQNAAVLAVCVGLVSLTLLELFARIGMTYGPGAVRSLIVRDSGWLLAIVGGLVAWTARPLKMAGILVGLATLSVLYVLIVRFRGLILWPGTFDYYWGEKRLWLVPACLGLIVGGLIGLWKRRSSDYSDRSVSLFVGLVFVSALAQAAASYVFAPQIDSSFAPTRFIAMTAIVFVLAAAIVTERRSR